MNWIKEYWATIKLTLVALAGSLIFCAVLIAFCFPAIAWALWAPDWPAFWQSAVFVVLVILCAAAFVTVWVGLMEDEDDV